MDRYDSVIDALEEVRPASLMRHRNSSPGFKPKSQFPRRSCDGHFAFLNSSSSSSSSTSQSNGRCRNLPASPSHHPHMIGHNPSEYQLITGRQFRPRVNTLPDALSVVGTPERDKVRDKNRARSQSYTPSPTTINSNNGFNGARRRRRSQDRIAETDNWTNYRKPSADLRKFSISDSNDFDCDYLSNNWDRSIYRILVLGADRVGKSSLLKQLVCEEEMNKFSRKDRNVKMLLQLEDKEISISFDNQPFRDDLLNNAHHEKINYNSVIVVYSIIDRRSFEISAQLLTMTIFDYKRINPNLKVCLIGNKSDLVRARQVDKSEGLSLANRFEVDFFEASIELEDNLEQILTWISNNVRINYGFPTSSTNHSHGKLRRALSYMRKVLSKNDRTINYCESENAI